MSVAKLMLVHLSIFAVAIVTVATLKAADPLCDGLSDDYIHTLPHEYNCSLYYECYNGNKTLLMCEDGLYFNEKTQSCDFPAVSGCTNGDSQCVDVELDYFPHVDNCSLYIECYLGDSYLMSCPPGYWFDSKEKRCVPPDQSDCVLATTPSWTTPHPSCWGVRPNETLLSRYEGDCAKYWKCFGAQLSLESCSWPLQFDEERQMCDFHEAVGCDDSTKTPDHPGSTHDYTTLDPPTTATNDDPRCIDSSFSYWPHPADCEKYVECWQGHSYEMTCPSGLHYNDTLKKCVDSSQSDCGRVTASPGTTPTTIISPHPDCPYPDGEGTSFPYPGDCTKYYVCAEGVKVEMPCPEGLYFNDELKICDYPYQANCTWGKISLFQKFYKYFIF